MGSYISREAIATHTETVRSATVTVYVRTVGGKLIAEATENSPVRSMPVSKTRLVGIVRDAVKPHIEKIGTPRLLSEAGAIHKAYALDENGHRVTTAMRTNTKTFVIGK